MTCILVDYTMIIFVQRVVSDKRSLLTRMSEFGAKRAQDSERSSPDRIDSLVVSIVRGESC